MTFKIGTQKSNKVNMTIRKIADYPDKKWWGDFNFETRKCNNTDHDIPNMLHLAPGTYEHTCPGCGETKTFTIHPVLIG